VIITVCSDIGAGVRGADQGINALLNLAKQSRQFDQLKTTACVVAFPEGFTSQYAKHIEQVLNISESVCEVVCDSRVSGHFPIVLSGDHSSAAGTIAGVKKANPESRLGVIWVDAHADLHTPFTSFSGNMHGMPVAAALGVDNLACLFRDPDKMTQEFWSQLKLIGGVFEKTRPSDVVYVSVRDLEEQEAYLIEKLGIRNFSTAELHDRKAMPLGEQILEYLKECTEIYLSFDTDCLDGSISKGTGLPVENGIMPKEAADLIGVILRDERVVCFEITELNPSLDINSTTINIVFHLLETAVDILKVNNRLE